MTNGKEQKPIIKTILLGDSSVGKTNILFQFVENKFYENTIPTIGIEYRAKTIIIDGQEVVMQAWDTAGQERFRSIAKSYYHGAQGFLLIYDVSSQATFDSIPNWISSIQDSTDVPIILIGNKCDLPFNVPKEEGERIANEYKIPFYLTSAKNGTNINEAFELLAREVLKSNIPKAPRPIPVDQEQDPKNSKKCCA